MEREAFERNRLRHARAFRFSAVRIALDAPSFQFKEGGREEIGKIELSHRD